MAGTLVRKVDVVWAGLPGAPFFTQFMFEHQAGQATPTAVAVRAFLQTFFAQLATGLTAQVQPEQTVIDVVTGHPTALETASPQSVVTYSQTGTPLPWTSQLVLRLATSQYNAGRRLRGRLFIPGAMMGMDNNGGVASATQTMVNGAAQTLITSSSSSGKWAVWSRRHLSWASVDAGTCWDQFGVLRSRRP